MSINLIRNCDRTIGRMRKGDVDLVCVFVEYVVVRRSLNVYLYSVEGNEQVICKIKQEVLI